MQERERARFEQHFVAVALDVAPIKRADRRFRFALRIAKGGKIVPTAEDLRPPPSPRRRAEASIARRSLYQAPTARGG
jgi:hypothetical protein